MIALVDSVGWDGPEPDVACVVSTYRRPEHLDGLLESLARQDLGTGSFEVVIVDNGSVDATWDRLVAAAAATPLRLRVIRLNANRGPGGGRNAGFAHVRAPLVAITDDDCLPEPGWLGGLLAVAASDVVVVQGRTLPERPPGPWDHTQHLEGPTPWFETCNVAYRHDALADVGGFDEADPLTARAGGGRAFGEDALLAHRLLARGGSAVFAPDAIVRHRVVPGRWRDHARGAAAMVGFPGLVDRLGAETAQLHRGVFLNPDRAVVDLAVVAVVVAGAAGRPWPLLATLPWARRRWPRAVAAAGGRLGAVPVLAGIAVADAIGAGALAVGSVRHRRLVL